MILSTMGVTRAAVFTGDTINKMKSNYSMIFNHSGLNEAEQSILETLSGEVALSKNNSNEANNYHIYIDNLYQHLSSDYINLSNNQANQVKEISKKLVQRMKTEEGKDFTQMSINGRMVTVPLAKQIYELCGLKLEMYTEGTINNILDENGHEMYRNTDFVPMDFHYSEFFLSLSIILILLVCMLILEYRLQLFKKGVRYNDFGEERYVKPITTISRLN